jgi:peptidyl-prolyl cis-trans isomerase SurA
VTPVAGQVNNAKRDDAKSTTEAQTKAQRLLRDIQGGQDFALVARDWSEDPESAPNGGDLSFRSLAELESIDPRLRAAVQRLKVGESSSLIETGLGFHIVKLLERDPGGQKDLSNGQVQAQIRQAIFNQKEQMLRAVFSEVSRNKAQVTNHLAERLLETGGKSPVVADGKAEEKTEAKKDEPGATPSAPAAPTTEKKDEAAKKDEPAKK